MGCMHQLRFLPKRLMGDRCAFPLGPASSNSKKASYFLPVQESNNDLWSARCCKYWRWRWSWLRRCWVQTASELCLEPILHWKQDLIHEKRTLEILLWWVRCAGNSAARAGGRTARIHGSQLVFASPVQSSFLPPKQATMDCNQSRTDPDISGTKPDHLWLVFCSPWNWFRLVQTGFFG